LTIEVIGHQWWWEVRYPESGVVTANEVVIPVGETVRLELSSVDVIHSFWVPVLNGKMDLIPGQTTSLPLEASLAGEYFGFCAEFCGVQHARMNLLVVAQERSDFDAWLATQQLAAPPPNDATTLAGQQVFLGSACVYCHTVRGTNASGKLGPDLTHLASRRLLGAGALPNTRGNLAGWIVNSQTTKPGNRMPPMYLGGSELQSLLAYLETLR
ncbi:MAG TPA: c-type cytochrome, partial [Trueperaceae bacterium]|nr:c-type cytochrome [Trueperaceae bacterium]